MSTIVKILKQSSLLTLIGVFFQLIGLIFMVLVAKKFGADSKVDAYYYVIALHFFLIAIIQNVFKIVLLPVLIYEKEKNPHELNLLFNNLIFISIALSLLVTFFLIIFVNLDFSRFFFPKDLDFEYYKYLVYLSSPLIVLNILSSIISNIYNSFQKFWFLEIVFNSRVLISFLIFYFFSDKIDILSLILGNVLGQFIVLLFAIYHLVARDIVNIKFDLQLHSSIKSISKLTYLPFLATILGAFQPLVNNYFLVEAHIVGNVSLFNYAQKIASIPTLIFSAGMLTVFVSHVSKLEVENKTEEVRNIITKNISFLVTLLIPSILFLFLIRFKLINLIFSGAKFSSSQVLIISNTLVILFVSFFFLQIHSLISRIFIVKQNTNFLVFISIIAFFVYLVSIYVLLFIFKFENYGISFALIVTNFVVCISSFFVANFKYDSINTKYVFLNLVKSLFVTIPMYFLFVELTLYVDYLFNNLAGIIALFLLFILLNSAFLFLLRQNDFISFLQKLYSLKKIKC